MNELYEIVSQVLEIEINEINDEYGSDDIEKWDSLGRFEMITNQKDIEMQ